jgi:lysyl-tRNA synthetase, class II
MASLEEIRAERIQKLEYLKSKGIDPYPAATRRDSSIADIRQVFDDLAASGETKTIAGRVLAIRSHGGSIFLDLFDGTGRLQAYLKQEDLGEKFELFERAADIGDFIEVSGTMFLTKKGEPSLHAASWTMLSKTLRPLPDKWHGLVDTEERFRKRYLDILMNPEMRELFEKKTLFWDSVRRFLKARGFMEVETPTLEVTTGGAEATPFKTYHEDFNLDVYLRISVGELWQKRLMAAGFPKTFEIGRAYRNEGSDMNHVQEFTNMEFYWAYASYTDGMQLVRELYRTIATEVFGTTSFETRGHAFDLAGEWKHIDYRQEVLERISIDVLAASDTEIANKLKELGVQYEGTTRERMTDTLWKYCRKSIAGPAFLVNHPKLVSPLSKSRPDNPLLTERFQVILAGSEVGNGFSELNDPLDQEERFKAQQLLIEAGDKEAMMPDFEFTEMLEYGMPPTCGFGFGETLFAFLSDKTLRETHLFPLMKPKDRGEQE